MNEYIEINLPTWPECVEAMKAYESGEVESVSAICRFIYDYEPENDTAASFRLSLEAAIMEEIDSHLLIDNYLSIYHDEVIKIEHDEAIKNSKLAAKVSIMREALILIMRRLQADIDDGSRPDQWSMEVLIRDAREALDD